MDAGGRDSTDAFLSAVMRGPRPVRMNPGPGQRIEEAALGRGRGREARVELERGGEPVAGRLDVSGREGDHPGVVQQERVA